MINLFQSLANFLLGKQIPQASALNKSAGNSVSDRLNSILRAQRAKKLKEFRKKRPRVGSYDPTKFDEHYHF